MNTEEFKNLNQSEREDAFLVACFDGDLATVKQCTSGNYFPTVDIFCNDHNDVQAKKGVCLEYAAENGYLEVIQYLISLPKGNNLYLIKGQDAFDFAYTNRHMDIVYYFIFEKEISEKIIDSYQYRSKSSHEELKSLFSKKHLYLKLNESLISKDKITTMKVKI